MARLEASPAPGRFKYSAPLEEYLKASREDLDTYLQYSRDALERNDPILFVLRFPVGDGYAFYRVVRLKPLTIQHIPYGDDYRIPNAYIRGLRLEDVYAQMRLERSWQRRPQ